MNWQWRDDNITFGITARFFFTPKNITLVPGGKPAITRGKERLAPGERVSTLISRFSAEAANPPRRCTDLYRRTIPETPPPVRGFEDH